MLSTLSKVLELTLTVLNPIATHYNYSTTIVVLRFIFILDDHGLCELEGSFKFIRIVLYN